MGPGSLSFSSGVPSNWVSGMLLQGGRVVRGFYWRLGSELLETGRVQDVPLGYLLRVGI